MNRLLGLYRETDYSPGRHRFNDVLVLEQTANLLRERKFTVDLKTIDEAWNQRIEYALVFSMCQGARSLETLIHWEDSGIVVMNSPRAARNTYRDRLADLMIGARIPFPETRLISTSAAESKALLPDEGLWLKRGDVHASVAADVQWIDSPNRLASSLARFAARGIDFAAVQTHRPGDEIKFYGVSDGSFFFWKYARSPSAGSRHFQFDASELLRLAVRAAETAGLDIFGGDMIVSDSGELTLIDLNDWPSFAPCRDQACEAIVDLIARRAQTAFNQGFISSANKSTL